MNLVYLRNVTTLKLTVEKCSGCGMCVNVCPHEVFIINSGKAKILLPDNCMECGACMRNCPEEAIDVRSGVGCAAGIIQGILKNTEPTCGCGDGGCC